MKTEVKIAIIGGLVAIIVAILTGLFSLLGSKSEKQAVSPQSVAQPAPSASATSDGRVIQMTGPNATYYELKQNNNGSAGEGK